MSTKAASPVDPRFEDIYKRAVYAFGTGFIFQRRARKYRRLVRWLTFFGIAIPGAIGAIVLANFFKKDIMDQLIAVAAVLGIIQFIFSIWSVVANWPDTLEYSSAAGAENMYLSSQLKALADQSASPPADFDIRHAQLIAMDDAQNALDEKRDITESEKIQGHRAALREFQIACVACGEIPQSTKMPFFCFRRCPVCGGHKKK